MIWGNWVGKIDFPHVGTLPMGANRLSHNL